MKRLPVCLVIAFSAAFCLFLNGCKAGHASGGRPPVLHYAWSPNTELLQNSAMRKDLLMKYLSSQLHIPVEVVTVEGYGPTMEAMRAEKVDIAGFGALGYIVASQKAGAEAIVSTGTPDGKLGVYYSVIAVPKGSPYNSLADLKAHAKDITFSFADPASTSGDLYPRVGLLNAGIHPEKDFKKVVFSSHLASLMAINAGKADAGGFSEMTRTRMIELKRLAPDSVRVIWTSEGIPNGPTTVRKGLPEDLKKQIQDALLHIPDRDPELWAVMASTYRSSSARLTQIPVNDATYDGLRRYAAQVKDFNFVDK